MRGDLGAAPARRGPRAVPPRAGQIGRIIFRQVVYTLPRIGRSHSGQGGRGTRAPAVQPLDWR